MPSIRCYSSNYVLPSGAVSYITPLFHVTAEDARVCHLGTKYLRHKFSNVYNWIAAYVSTMHSAFLRASIACITGKACAFAHKRSRQCRLSTERKTGLKKQTTYLCALDRRSQVYVKDRNFLFMQVNRSRDCKRKPTFDDSAVLYKNGGRNMHIYT